MNLSPHAKYTADRGRRRLLQMSLVSVRLGNPVEGKSFTVLLKTFP